MAPDPVGAAMRFRVEGRVEAPPQEVMRVYHGRLEALGVRLPDVARAEVLERTPARTRVRWFARGDIPAAVRHVLRPEDLSWEDDVAWDFEGGVAEARVRRPGFDRARCDSRIRFLPADGGTRVVCDGELRFDVPLVGGLLERLFAGHAEANVRAFLDLLAREVAEARA